MLHCPGISLLGSLSLGLRIYDIHPPKSVLLPMAPTAVALNNWPPKLEDAILKICNCSYFFLGFVAAWEVHPSLFGISQWCGFSRLFLWHYAMLNILHVYCIQLFALCSSIVPICSKFMSSVASCFHCFHPNISHFVRNCSTFPKIFGFVRKYLNISQFLANPVCGAYGGLSPNFIPDKFLGAKLQWPEL